MAAFLAAIGLGSFDVLVVAVALFRNRNTTPTTAKAG